MPKVPATSPIILSALLLFVSSSAIAWNGEGHQIVGWIAEERLTPKAKAVIAELLGDASLSDGEVANWADEIRRERRKTAPWHYVNIPVDAKAYDAERDGNGGDNVVDAITRFSSVLADRNASKEDRVEALKFVVHFVGDLHQPLHCADRNGDKGGNKLLVFFPGQRKALSLHSVWDTFLLRSRKEKQSVAEYGARLNASTNPTMIAAWKTGGPLDWAEESWGIARDAAYAKLPIEGPLVKLPAAYVVDNAKMVDAQLMRAGVRLAELINQSLR